MIFVIGGSAGYSFEPDPLFLEDEGEGVEFLKKGNLEDQKNIVGKWLPRLLDSNAPTDLEQYFEIDENLKITGKQSGQLWFHPIWNYYAKESQSDDTDILYLVIPTGQLQIVTIEEKNNGFKKSYETKLIATYRRMTEEELETLESQRAKTRRTTEFLAAVGKSDLPTMDKLYQEGVDNTAIPQAMNAAISLGSEQVIQWLLDHPANYIAETLLSARSLVLSPAVKVEFIRHVFARFPSLMNKLQERNVSISTLESLASRTSEPVREFDFIRSPNLPEKTLAVIRHAEVIRDYLLEEVFTLDPSQDEFRAGEENCCNNVSLSLDQGKLSLAAYSSFSLSFNGAWLKRIYDWAEKRTPGTFAKKDGLGFTPHDYLSSMSHVYERFCAPELIRTQARIGGGNDINENQKFFSEKFAAFTEKPDSVRILETKQNGSACVFRPVNDMRGFRYYLFSRPRFF